MILNKQVGVYLNLVHCKFKQYISEIFKEQGCNITPEQFLVLDALWDEGDMSQQEIANLIIKDKNSVVKLLDGLEKKKFVKRVIDKKDRRQNIIQLTRMAEEIKDHVTEVAIKSVDMVIEGISKKDLGIFIKVLAAMATNMRQDISPLQIQHKQKQNTVEK
ncbi:MAG: MarR family transcriptional regulator [Bacteroidales bacterium]|jgi:DNA-binding MarR family transcriptional regulator|nr:MarR family transcriptional regulator [Bacteroidales bacterium]